jgi:hypothetical protein
MASAICPDNSTECLLRELIAKIDAQSGFNWNLLNFAFTAAIGILALVVAMTTVFQGLLGAGPGRLKASKAAIGPYSRNTKTKFDRAELRYRTTAMVPFVRRIWTMSTFGDKQMREEIKLYPGRWVMMLEAAGGYCLFLRRVSLCSSMDHGARGSGLGLHCRL